MNPLPLQLTLDANNALIRRDYPAARAALLRLEAACSALRLSLPDVPLACGAEPEPQREEASQ